MPATCPKCFQPNRDTAQFCAACGGSLILVSRYRLVRVLGTGGFSTVYQVDDLRLPGKKWAAKEMSDDRLADPAEKQAAIHQFQREAQFLASLNHPNILRVVDSFQQGSKHYIISDLIDGQTLAERLTHRGPLSEAEVRNVLGQLCSALAYLHNLPSPIIFRDLKPQNIMVDQAGQVRLIDFGIARVFRPGQAQDTMLLGTAGYAPPEQYGQGQTDARSDIYALGVTIYELLTACDPARTPYRLPPVRSAVPNISRELERVIDRCLQLRPEDRWQNVDQLLAALQPAAPAAAAYQQGLAVAPTPLAPHRPTTRLLMAAAALTNGQLAAVLAGFVLLAALGVWVLGPILQQHVPWLWNNVPAFCIAGPLGYAATRRKGAAAVTHVALTVVGWLTWALRSGDLNLNALQFVLATAFSALAVEAMMWAVPAIRGKRGDDAWLREAGWFALGGLAAAVVFYVFLMGPTIALRFGMMLGALFVGALGWFLGDLVDQAIRLRRGGRGLRPQLRP